MHIPVLYLWVVLFIVTYLYSIYSNIPVLNLWVVLHDMALELLPTDSDEGTGLHLTDHDLSHHQFDVLGRHVVLQTQMFLQVHCGAKLLLTVLTRLLARVFFLTMSHQLRHRTKRQVAQLTVEVKGQTKVTSGVTQMVMVDVNIMCCQGFTSVMLQ